MIFSNFVKPPSSVMKLGKNIPRDLEIAKLQVIEKENTGIYDKFI